MTPLESAIVENRDAVEGFIAAARGVGPERWRVPPAEEKWSPAQIAEHVTLAFEYSRAVLDGNPPGPAAPRLLRPLVRTFFVKPVLKHGRFTRKGRAPSMFQPSSVPSDPPELIARLEAALRGFEEDLRAAARSGRSTLDHPFFGTMTLTDYLRLQSIHARHHRAQLPGAVVAA